MIRLWSKGLPFSQYLKKFQQAIQDPNGYWAAEAKELSWFVQPHQILDDSNSPFIRWFSDGKINITYNLLDRNLEAGRGSQIAYHIESPITDSVSMV